MFMVCSKCCRSKSQECPIPMQFGGIYCTTPAAPLLPRHIYSNTPFIKVKRWWDTATAIISTYFTMQYKVLNHDFLVWMLRLFSTLGFGYPGNKWMGVIYNMKEEDADWHAHHVVKLQETMRSVVVTLCTLAVDTGIHEEALALNTAYTTSYPMAKKKDCDNLIDISTPSNDIMPILRREYHYTRLKLGQCQSR